jgi:uncharacterized protein
MLSRSSGYSAYLIVLMLSGLWSVAASTKADAASFDCSKAKLAVETAICQDDKLSRLDEQLALQYFKLRSYLRRPSARQLATRQRSFVSARNECEQNTDCLAQIYKIRMDELCKLGQINGHPCSVLFKTMTAKDHPQLNYCHMDECGWFVIRDVKHLAKNRAGELLELKVIDGSSEHYLSDSGQSGYPDAFDESIPIDWAAEPSITHVFCSKILPAVLYQKEGGGVEVAPLDFGGQGIFGYNSSAAGLYVYTCQHLDPSAYAADGFGAKYGIRPLPEDLKIEISRVSEILDVAAKVAEGKRQ